MVDGHDEMTGRSILDIPALLMDLCECATDHRDPGLFPEFVLQPFLVSDVPFSLLHDEQHGRSMACSSHEVFPVLLQPGSMPSPERSCELCSSREVDSSENEGRIKGMVSLFLFLLLHLSSTLGEERNTPLDAGFSGRFSVE